RPLEAILDPLDAGFFFELIARERHASRRDAMHADLAAEFLAEDAVMAAVAKVNYQADQKPGSQAKPIGSGQGEHKKKTAGNSQDRNNWDQRATERPLSFRVGAPHNQHCTTNDDKGKQGPNICQ